MEGPRPRASEKFLKMAVPTLKTTAKPQQQQHQQQYESGLEVAEPNAWNRNDIHLPEVSPYNNADAQTTTLPQVVDDQLSWHHYHKQSPNLDATTPSVTSAAAAPYYFAAGTGQQHPPGYHQPPPGSPGSGSLDGAGDGNGKTRTTMCGVRRKVCYVIMGVAIVLAVAAIAVGLGVGLAMKKSGGSSGNKSTSGNSTTTPPTSTRNAVITCPSSDNATYASPDAPARTFRLICGHDFNSANGATDLTSENATTMATCIDLCASKGPDCVGAGWGDYYGNHVCWMKSKLGTMNVSGNWYFAVDVNETSVAA
ncbi:hypothetical protein CORC01_09080 [Colletotrichum orchidophilum]|uniref:Apple domain-containing protein n=1 Tax=Colletotrichum orchidophilum TaxID=1209926 RepID=A0A1G4B2J4_9PEZI|nr:uncharacterized protein CORC01_09080 [Colletotrichum orchidophilum]OHE95648.1 hypothetical protein CORC01_09080 [Colletotrichum orchidophilum]